MAEIGVPAGLAGLFEPNQAEVAAAKLDRPFLIGAYGLDRIAGRGRIEEMANETNAIKTLLAMRKLQQERSKDLAHYTTQAPFSERFDQPASIWKQVFPELNIQDAVPGLPQAIQAQKRKPSGSINLGDDTVTETTVEGEPGQNPTIVQRRSKRKVGTSGVPTPPASAAPKAAAPQAEVKVPAGVKRGEVFQGPKTATNPRGLYRAE